MPSENELTAFGFTPADYEGEIGVWPDNWLAYVVFRAMRTQWRTVAIGRTGLDYGALPEIWRRTEIPVGKRNDIFRQVQIMEEAALSEMYATGNK